jgi:hypothetical protein
MTRGVKAPTIARPCRQTICRSKSAGVRDGLDQQSGRGHGLRRTVEQKDVLSARPLAMLMVLMVMVVVNGQETDDANDGRVARMDKFDGHAALLTQACGTTRDRHTAECFCLSPQYQGSGAPPERLAMCVGTGAKGTWESLMAHGRGLAQEAPRGVVREDKAKTQGRPFPPLLKPTVCEGPMAVTSSGDRHDVQAAHRSATRADRSALCRSRGPSRCSDAQRQPS